MGIVCKVPKVYLEEFSTAKVKRERKKERKKKKRNVFIATT